MARTVKIENLPPADPTTDYKLTDTEELGGTSYFGYVTADQGWFIMKGIVQESTGIYRYTRGTGNYTTNWNNRASLTYKYFYEIF